MIYKILQTKLILVAILIFGTSAEFFATDGDLDPTFGNGGIVTTDNGSGNEIITDLAVQPDGKIIAVGNSHIGSPLMNRTVVVRYDSNGNIDVAFGTSGKVAIQSVENAKLDLQSNGKIIISGTRQTTSTDNDVYVARLNSDGSFDTTFNGTGEVVLDLRVSNDIVSSVKVQPDGKIVVSGKSISSDPNSNGDIAVIRLDTNGSLDATFGTGGKVFTMVASQNGFAIITDLAIQPDGKILVVGGGSFLIVRYNTDGSLDITFDGDGIVRPQSEEFIKSVAVQPDGKILVSARVFIRDGIQIVLLRFNANGSPDSSLSGNAVITAGDALADIAIQVDKKIVVSFDFPVGGVTRFNNDGTRDVAFGDNGRRFIPRPSNTSNTIRLVAIQPDGKILVGGARNNSGGDFLIARLEASSSIPGRETIADFDGDGKTDASVFRNENWFINPSSANDPTTYYGVQFGLSTDKLVPADYDGDGKTDLAVWRENVNGTLAFFYILQSSDNVFRVAQFGETGDDPRMVGDWDGDGRADLAVYRSGANVGDQSTFYYRPSSRPSVDFVPVYWGANGDEAVRGDFDGDNKMDAAIFRPSNNVWYILQSSNGQIRYEDLGFATDKRVAGDFDGDGKDDLAIYRDGLWVVQKSSDNQRRYEQWGLNGDSLVAGDYDGDGLTDFAVWRAGVYYVLPNATSQPAYQQFGISSDIPVASAFVR